MWMYKRASSMSGRNISQGISPHLKSSAVVVLFMEPLASNINLLYLPPPQKKKEEKKKKRKKKKQNQLLVILPFTNKNCKFEILEHEYGYESSIYIGYESSSYLGTNLLILGYESSHYHWVRIFLGTNLPEGGPCNASITKTRQAYNIQLPPLVPLTQL